MPLIRLVGRAGKPSLFHRMYSTTHSRHVVSLSGSIIAYLSGNNSIFAWSIDYVTEVLLSGTGFAFAVLSSGALYDNNTTALLSGAALTLPVGSSGALYDFNQPSRLSGAGLTSVINSSGALYDVNNAGLLSGTGVTAITWT